MCSGCCASCTSARAPTLQDLLAPEAPNDSLAGLCWLVALIAYRACKACQSEHRRKACMPAAVKLSSWTNVRAAARNASCISIYAGARHATQAMASSARMWTLWRRWKARALPFWDPLQTPCACSVASTQRGSLQRALMCLSYQVRSFLPPGSLHACYTVQLRFHFSSPPGLKEEVSGRPPSLR